MILRYFAGLSHRRLCVVALVLCICVLMQMLGAPVTLLSAGDLSDEFSGSVLEGFSLPQTLPPLTRSSESVLAVERPRLGYLPILPAEQFHPPAI